MYIPSVLERTYRARDKRKVVNNYGFMGASCDFVNQCSFLLLRFDKVFNGFLPSVSLPSFLCLKDLFVHHISMASIRLGYLTLEGQKYVALSVAQSKAI